MKNIRLKLAHFLAKNGVSEKGTSPVSIPKVEKGLKVGKNCKLSSPIFNYRSTPLPRFWA